MKNSIPKVSIITVTYNAEKYIERTIQSIISQTYLNIEYIIVDGNSQDQTVKIANKYANRISKIISEPDKGLYDAMNKGIKHSSGDYIWFMNAGDLIYSKHTLEKIFNKVNDRYADIYYGDTMIIDEDGNEIGKRRLRPPENLTWKSFRKGMLVSHQSIIIKKEQCRIFDIEYKYSADFDAVIKSLKKTTNIQNTHQTISCFLAGGQTSKTIVPGLFERFRIMKKHYGIISTLFYHVFITARLASQFLAKVKF